MKTLLLSLVLVGFTGWVQLPSACAALELDGDHEGGGFDIEMSVHLDEDQQGWAVWKRYHMSEEWVMARPLDAGVGSVGEVFDVADGAGIVDGVSLAASDDGKVMWVFWSSYVDAQWQVMGRRWRDAEGWGNIHSVSAGDGGDQAKGHALKPRAVVTNDGRLVVAWHQLIDGASSRGWMRVFGNDGWQSAIAISGKGDVAFRVVPVITAGKVWLLWDSGESAIKARPVWPKLDEEIVVDSSDPARSEMPRDPSRRMLHGEPVGSVSEGLCVARLNLADVIAAETRSSDDEPLISKLTAESGGEGVVDMLHYTNVFHLRNDGTSFSRVLNPRGFDDPVVMLSGLLPDLRPSKGYPSGYSGRRRHPIMVDGEGGHGGAWMIWERKSNPAGGGSKTAGQLLGRHIKDGVWGETVLLMDGLIDYRAALPAKVREGKMWVVGAKIPHHWKRPSQLVAIDVSAAQPFEQDLWMDQYSPLSIDQSQKPKRYSTEVTGREKPMKLFWGDLHCHSGLTGDAEGEPDEILFYARDRAGLDVMVMQDNDDVHGRILTEGEYYMGVAHSQWATQPGRFVALPGYEWTQRTSDKGVARPDLSAFEQTVPGGYPNHRTVIYPHRGGPIVRYFEVEQDFGKMADAVHAAGGILNSQHPAFKISDHPAEANLEVVASWGIYIRSVPKRFHEELDKGRHTGFVGTSDSHRRNPGLCGGLTGIWAEQLTSEAILEALREHRCFATNGSRIVVDSRAQGKMTDEVVKATADGSAELTLYVRGTKPLTRVALVGDGGTVEVYEGDGTKEMSLTRKVDGLKPGRHWFYWEIEQEGDSKQYSGNISKARGHRAWSSPHFVDVE